MSQLEKYILENIPAPVYLVAPDFTIRYANRYFRENLGDPTSGYCYQVINGRDEPCENCVLSNGINPWGVQERETFCSDDLIYQVVGIPFQEGEGAPLLLGLGCDITARKASELVLQRSHDEMEKQVQRRTEELSRLNRHLCREIEKHQETEIKLRQQQEICAAVVRLKKALLSPIALKEIPNLVLREAKHFTGSSVGFVGHIDPRTGLFLHVTMDNTTVPICEMVDNPGLVEHYQGLWAWVLRHKKPLLLNDPFSDPRSRGTPPGHLPIRRVLSVPSVSDNNLVGIIALANAQRDYTPKDLELVERLADIYALALQRKLSEEDLRWTNEYLNGLIQASPLAIAVLDQDGTMMLWNHAARKIFGWSKKEVFTDGLRIFTADMAQRFKFMHESIVKGQVVPSMGLKARTKKGSLLDINMYSAPVHSVEAPGKVCCAIYIMDDVTAEKRMESALRDSEHKLRKLSTQLLHTLENERKRIALELHDRIGQSLTAIKYCVESALVQEGGLQQADILQSGVAMIQSSIDEVRKIAIDLRPSMLDDLGLLATINWFSREFRIIYKNFRITKRIYIKNEEEIPEALKIIIYRVLQEAFNNIAKHSKASRVLLVLKKTNNNLELKIKDNGQGFAPENLVNQQFDAKGLGLASMREQAEMSGGRFTILSVPGEGTTIRTAWPL